jgi:glycine/sarcosine N-methyltransferase
MRNFDFLARHYNAMTGFPGRVATLSVAMRPWVDEWGVKSALDAGCGGGALMFALDELGVAPTGLDLSEPMLRLAIKNAREREKRFPFHGAPHSSAGVIFPETFDAVFCLGNALIGEPDDVAMTSSLTGLQTSLKPGGHLLVQILNLTPFFLGLKNVIARRTVDGFEYLRFATAIEDRLVFNALVFDQSRNVLDVQTSVWERWDADRVIRCVWQAGFDEVECYGSFDKKPFDARSSTDVVIAARRQK